MLRRPNYVKKIHAFRKNRPKPEPGETVPGVLVAEKSMKLLKGLQPCGVLSEDSLKDLQDTLREMILDVVRSAIPPFAEEVNRLVTDGVRYRNRLDRQLLVGSMAIAYEAAQARLLIAADEAFVELLRDDHAELSRSVEEDILGRLAPRDWPSAVIFAEDVAEDGGATS